MSDSIHQTFRSVLGGKTPSEIQRMIDERDPDLLALIEKRRRKRAVREERALGRWLDALEEGDGVDSGE